MIRFKDRIDIKTNRHGATAIQTDMGGYYNTSRVSNHYGSPRTQWWEHQHHGEIREWQKDVLLGEVDRLYRRINPEYEMNYYLVYREGEGFSQPHDIVFARIPQANIWILGTREYSWIHYCDLENFSLHPNTSILGDILNSNARKQYYKTILDPIEAHILQTE